MTGLQVIILLAAIPATLFPLIYAFQPFWREVAGQAIMVLSVGLAVMVDSALLRETFGEDYPGRDVVRILVFVLVIGGMWYLLFALVWTLWRGERRRGGASVP